jgi:hypothetical protein
LNIKLALLKEIIVPFRKQRILWLGMKHAVKSGLLADTEPQVAEAHAHISRLAVAAIKYIDAGRTEQFFSLLELNKEDQEEILHKLGIGRNVK